MKSSIAQFPQRIIQGTLSLIYPPRCQICQVNLNIFDSRVLCEVCYNSIKFNEPPFCGVCGKSHTYQGIVCGECKTKTYYFDASYAVCVYEGVIRECIHKFKYTACLSLEKLLKKLMVEFAEKYINMERYDALIPVPLHRVKHKERSFNQSSVFAAYVSKRFRLPLLKNNLIRTRLGKPQIALSKNERLKDIKGSFKIKNPSAVKGKSLLLIDDVFTTGSTVNECSRVLKEAGADSVEVLTLAKGL